MLRLSFFSALFLVGAAPAAAQLAPYASVPYAKVAYEDVVYEAAHRLPTMPIEGGERAIVAEAPRTLSRAGAALAPLRGGAAPVRIAAYGPFRVRDAHRADLVAVTDSRSPAAFLKMLRDHPGIAEIDMIECPGTEDDTANLALGRLIRSRGIATRVPDGGSVRSGAVELFLAGARRYAGPRAEFAVHAWIDDSGREPGDYAADAPENRRYTDYYREMGMTLAQARAFYAMTNSVPFESARWFDGAEMGRWVALDGA